MTSRDGRIVRSLTPLRVSTWYRRQCSTVRGVTWMPPLRSWTWQKPCLRRRSYRSRLAPLDMLSPAPYNVRVRHFETGITAQTSEAGGGFRNLPKHHREISWMEWDAVLSSSGLFQACPTYVYLQLKLPLQPAPADISRLFPIFQALQKRHCINMISYWRLGFYSLKHLW